MTRSFAAAVRDRARPDAGLRPVLAAQSGAGTLPDVYRAALCPFLGRYRGRSAQRKRQQARPFLGLVCPVAGSGFWCFCGGAAKLAAVVPA